MQQPEIHNTETVEDYLRSWMQPFLDAYTYSGDLAGTAALFLISPRNVFFQVKHHPRFALAFAEAQAEVAERIWSHCKHRVLGDDLCPVNFR